MKEILRNFLYALGNHMRTFWESFRTLFHPRYSDVPFERIVFITGINSPLKRITPMTRYLSRQFPDVEIVMIQDYYIHSQQEKIEKIIQRSVDVLSDTSAKTLVIGHSFGGLVALAALQRMSGNKDHILLLATLASPHNLDDFGVCEARKAHSIPQEASVPTMTFGGRIDAVVPDTLSRLDGEVCHITISCTHIAFVRTSRTRKEVLAAIMQYFSLREK